MSVYLQFSEDGEHIRKWSWSPFEGGAPWQAQEPPLTDALHRIGGPLRVDGFNAVFAGKEDFSAMIVRDDEPGCSSILAQGMSDQMAHDFIAVIDAAASPTQGGGA